MKKFLLVIALVAIFATGTVFADHPDGFGLGGLYTYGGFGRDVSDPETAAYASIFSMGYGLSLKIPGVPIFWGLKVAFNSFAFGLALTGDYYFIDQQISDVGLGWYLGAGLFVDWFNIDVWLFQISVIDFGLRVPIGLDFIFDSKFEIFLEAAPSAGLGLPSMSAGGVTVNGDPAFLWDVPVTVGVRYWF